MERVMESRIMYVCEGCLENNAEACGHFDRKKLRIAPNGEWMCVDCYDNHESTGIDDSWLNNWCDLPIPPEYKPV